jgi:hypothetical protein
MDPEYFSPPLSPSIPLIGLEPFENDFISNEYLSRYPLRNSLLPIELVYLHYCTLHEIEHMSPEQEQALHPWQIQMLLADAMNHESLYLQKGTMELIERFRKTASPDTHTVFGGGVFRQHLVQAILLLMELPLASYTSLDDFFERFLRLLDPSPTHPWSLPALLEQRELMVEMIQALEHSRFVIQFHPSMSQFANLVHQLYVDQDNFPDLNELQIIEKPLALMGDNHVQVKMKHSPYPQTLSLDDVAEVTIDGFQEALTELMESKKHH